MSASGLAAVATLPDAVVAGQDPLSRAPRPRGGIVLTILLSVVALLWISPLLLLITTGIRPLSDFVARGPLSWPSELTGQNFRDAWAIGKFADTYRNSAFLLVVKVPLGVLLSGMLAFALSKLKIRFRRTIMFAVFLGLTIPIYITIVPVFIMLRSAGLTDNVLGLIGPYLAFGIPLEVLILQSFFRQIPDSIVESARIDGASEWRIFFTLIVPLAAPALITVAILDAVATWNEFLFALIVLSSDTNKTIPVGLLSFQGQFSNNNTGLAAGILIAVVPILIAYALLQRWIVGGLTAGAEKG